MSSIPEKNTNGIKSFSDTKLAADIVNIHKALVVDIDVRKIPESTFVKEILPVLTGEVISADFPLLMAAVAGGPFSEIDIIDDAGNTLFRLPALLERDIISHTEASKRGSMASMMQSLAQVNRLSPIRAQNYLSHEFSGRGIATNRDELYKKRQERFITILARYGKTLNTDGTVQDLKDKPAAGKKESLPLDFNDGDLL